MCRTRFKLTDRVLAILLSVLIIFATVPVVALQAFAATTEKFTITVMDGENPIEGATVTLTGSEDCVGFEMEATTDENGAAVFLTDEMIEKLSATTSAEYATINASISKDGYDTLTYKINSVPVATGLTSYMDSTESLTVAAPNTATVSVTVTGDATVEVNGTVQNSATVDIGTEVPVKITPADGSYIKNLTVGGETVPVTKGEAYEGTVKADADVAIVATVVKEFTVSAPAVEGGAITLNGGNDASLTVDENTKVTVGVIAADGYQISSVAIGGAAQTLENNTTFSKEITVTANTEITVVFAKVYTITVTHTGNGTVVTEPTTVGGSVTVVKDITVKITADPDDNYRVSEVKINGVADATITGANFGIEDKYVKNLTADKDYTVAITFAPNRYTITATDTTNGTVSIESNLVDYNGSTKVSLVPEIGYTVESVKVNGVETEVTTPDDTTAYFVIESIVEDKEIVVTFTRTTTADISDVSFNTEDTLRPTTDSPDNTLYVFAKDATVTFTTEKDGIRIYDTTDNHVGGSWNTNSVAISSTTSIGRISLYYKADGERMASWHDVAGITNSNPLSIVVDVTEAEPTINPTAANKHGYYNSDVSVAISAEDKGDYSGIGSIEYWITNAGTETVRETIYTYEAGGEIKNVYTKNIIVSAADNNSDEVVVNVKVIDRAGNENSTSTTLKINATAPSVSVAIDGSLHKEAIVGNYNDVRTATITYIDRATTFNETTAMDGIVISAKDSNGRDVAISKASMIEWSHSGDTHTATISFTVDANYVWSVSYENDAGLSDNKIDTTGDSVYEFAIDTNAPTGEITLDKTAWDNLISTLTFGIFKNYDVTAEVAGADETTDINVVYYKTSETTALTVKQLDALFAEEKFTEERITVSADERFTVYARITDLAGNTIYISTNGVIYDKTGSAITINPPTANENGYYNKDIVIPVSVNDAVNPNTTYSGIKSIDYEVINVADNKVTQSANLYTFDIANPTYDQLRAEWNGSITVESLKNNSNNIKVTVKVTDNANNEYEKSVIVKIDITTPTIDVNYDNNSADNAKYFKDNRTATIVVTERNFKAEDVKIIITNKDGVIPTVSTWTKTEGTGNLDDTKWTATVTYSADGDYTFDIAYTDLADNACAGAQYGNSVAPTEFTVDKTLPEVSVTYNNNDEENDKYFDKARTATIDIKEHNFDVNRVTFTQTAKLNGTEFAVPTASWVNNGDVHTATIVFDRDGDYTFDIMVKDMAGNDSEAANYGNSVAAKDFVVDQTIEKPTIGGVENGSAYKNDVVPTISFSDVNYDSYEVKLVRTRLGEKNVDVTDKFIKSVTEQAQGGSDSYDTFEKIVENDGIYTLTVKMIDKAGNEETEEYTFTVNRFGSVYEYGDELVALIKDGGQYIKNVDGDLVITEYNADRLLAGSLKILITRDGETVDVDFTSNPADINAEVGIGESGWYQYVYTVKASNFEKDGVYKISLASKYAAVDSPENDSTSVPENSIDKQGNAIVDTMNFTVDSVAPEIRNIVNLDQRIADVDKIVDGKLNVKYTIVDVGGLKTIEIIVNGETVQTLTEEDIADNAYNFSGSFDIAEQDGTTAQKVRIVVTDLAGNVTDTDSDDFLKAHSEDNEDSTYVFFNEVTVSRNFFVRWYANTGLFWGSIAGVVVLAGAIWFLIAFKRKKKEEGK